ncbi:MAG: hypothetical protein H6741_11645 [Alphaproteobacteria bacterium]|nr:hypothetical protein [Alphaproteobacteria bacterium]
MSLVDAWSPTPPSLRFDWRLTRTSPGALRIEWSVWNDATERLWLAQAMLRSEGGLRRDPRPVVRGGGAPGLALVGLGFFPLDAPAYHQLPPLYGAVEPGEQASGALELGWPLRAWHPSGPVAPLEEVSALIFALDGFFGEPAAWRELRGAEGEALRVPSYSSRHWIHGPAQAVPG